MSEAQSEAALWEAADVAACGSQVKNSWSDCNPLIVQSNTVRVQVRVRQHDHSHVPHTIRRGTQVVQEVHIQAD